MGCDGAVVSNHGGRKLDGTPSTIDALPECVKAADGKVRVHVDGGSELVRIYSRLLLLVRSAAGLGRQRSGV